MTDAVWTVADENPTGGGSERLIKQFTSAGGSAVPYAVTKDSFPSLSGVVQITQCSIHDGDNEHYHSSGPMFLEDGTLSDAYQLRTFGSTIAIYDVFAGTSLASASMGFTQSLTQFVITRFEWNAATGELKARAWPDDGSTPEPGSWQVTYTDSVPIHTPTHMGLGALNRDVTAWCRFFGVGTDGDSAPLSEAALTAPTGLTATSAGVLDWTNTRPDLETRIYRRYKPR